MSLSIYLTTPICPTCGRSEQVFEHNITHNLTEMADAAGLYLTLWYPEKLGITKASQATPILEAGLAHLKAGEAYLKRFNPANGWGSYSNLLICVESYLEACKKHPEAIIEISR